MTTYRDRHEAGEHTDKDANKRIQAEAKAIEKAQADRDKRANTSSPFAPKK